MSSLLLSRIIGQKYRDGKIVAQRSKKPKTGFGRTTVKSTIWPYDGQRDQFLICGWCAPRMGKKPWGETFGTIGIKVQSLSVSKFRKFDPWPHHKRTEPRFLLHAGQRHHLVIRRSKSPIHNFPP